RRPAHPRPRGRAPDPPVRSGAGPRPPHARLLLRRRLDPRQPRHLGRHLPHPGQRRALPGDLGRLPARAPAQAPPPRPPPPARPASPAPPWYIAETPAPARDRAGVAGPRAGAPRAAVVWLLPRARGGPSLAPQALISPNPASPGPPESMRDNDAPAMFNHHSV